MAGDPARGRVRLVVLEHEGRVLVNNGQVQLQGLVRGYAVRVDGAGVASITCLSCGATSYNAHDIAEKYCGRCHRFLEDPADQV